MFTAAAIADDAVNPNKVPGTPVFLQQENTVQVSKDGKQPLFRDVLIQFSATPSDGSPKSVVVAGTVVDNNTGGRKELVPIFLGSPLHAPRLAALTNVDGEFRFRLWLKEDQRELRLQTPTLDDAILYLGSGVGGGVISFGPSADATGMSAFSYPFRDLLAAPLPTPTQAK